MSHPCTDCPNYTGEVAFTAAKCADHDGDTCVEHRLRGLVREQWIYETAPTLPCKRCSSTVESCQSHPELGVTMTFCGNCDLPKGPLGASPIDVARANLGLSSGSSRRIARRHLDYASTWRELASNIGYDFRPQSELEPWRSKLAAMAAAAKATGLVLFLAQVGGDWL